MKAKASNFLKLKELKQLTNNFSLQLLQINRSIKEHYEDDMNNVKEELLVKIASDYSLDLSELKNKYLKRKKKKTDNDDTGNDQSDSEYLPSVVNNNIGTDELLLYKVNYDDCTYYIELIDGGKVYDINYNVVGIWKDGMMELDYDLIKKLSNNNNKSINESNIDINMDKLDIKYDNNLSNMIEKLVELPLNINNKTKKKNIVNFT